MSNEQPRRWWQWVLVYPTLLTGVLTFLLAAWQVYQTSGTGIHLADAGEAKYLKEQNALAERNFECMMDLPSAKHLKTPTNIQILVLPCEKTGDIMVRGTPPDDLSKSKTTWLAAEKLIDTRIAGLGLTLFPEALAEDLDDPLKNHQVPQQVICQRWVGQGMLLQRVQTLQGCFDIVINTYYGTVVQSAPAPCYPQC